MGGTTWVRAGPGSILEEDWDFGHGIGKQNIVQKWKEVNGLEYYWNYPGSPDLAPIENTWGIQKAYMSKFTHWEVEETYELTLEA